jgi:phospholipid/cholesterol/gamma-HCH transport system substrate-binding protein
MVYATLAIVRGAAARVREDTLARVSNKGLLGDKMIELNNQCPAPPEPSPAQPSPKSNVDGYRCPGTNLPPQLKDGDFIRAEEPVDLFTRADEIAKRVQAVVERLDPLARELADPRLHASIRGAAANVSEVLDAVVHKDSPVHRLLYDQEQAKRVSATIANVERASAEASGVISDVHHATSRVRVGPGLAHKVLYDEQVANDLAGTVGEARKALTAVREGQGIAHTVVYGDANTQNLLANLTAMSQDLRGVVASMKQGKGTLGGLLVDPSIYEDLKAAVGNIERNQVLRALVRYSIRQDESRAKAGVNEAPKSAPSGSK